MVPCLDVHRCLDVLGTTDGNELLAKSGAPHVLSDLTLSLCFVVPNKRNNQINLFLR